MVAPQAVVSDIILYCQYVLSHEKHDSLGACLTGILGSG